MWLASRKCGIKLPIPTHTPNTLTPLPTRNPLPRRGTEGRG
jgi:hypothetical protein